MSGVNPYESDRSVVASAELIERLEYDPVTGRWFFDRPAGHWPVGIYSFFFGTYVRLGDCQILLHRLVMQKMGHDTVGLVVHHLNNDPTDSRYCNLMLCTPSQHSSLHQRIRRGEWPKPDDWVEWNSRPDYVAEFRKAQLLLPLSSEISL